MKCDNLSISQILVLCSLVTPYGDRDIWVKFGSDSLLANDTKPLPEQMLTYHQGRSVVFTSEQFHKKCS